MSDAATRFHRTLDQVLEDGLYPGSGLCPDPELQGWRYQAAADVLRRLPPEPYGRLKAAAESFAWFLPDPEVRGMVMPFFVNVTPRKRKGESTQLTPYARVLYLAPHLENAAWDVAVAIVAHELVHIILGHPPFSDDAAYEENEEAVFRHLCEWGFAAEALKHRKVSRWRSTYRKSEVNRFLAKNS